MSSSLLAAVELAPRDPILGVTEAFNSDPNPKKVNLGVGVYTDDSGRVPVLECVKRAEQHLTRNSRPRGYLPIEGMKAFDTAAQALLFGGDHPAVVQGRIVTVQSLGGTGALKLGADFLRRIAPSAQAWISNPSWENHRALFEFAGFGVDTYAYYDAKTHGADFVAMMSNLERLRPGSIVVLHACCHNPTGVDLVPAQWEQVIRVVNARNLIPFLDIAYQGFGEGLDADAYAVRRFAEACPVVLVAGSFSKSLSLYGERIGALSIVTESSDEAARVMSQLKRVIRTNYSNPPMHGSELAAMVLSTPELRVLWEQELGEMRERIKAMRKRLVARIRELRADLDFNHVLSQWGMFSYSGLSKAQVDRLRAEYSIYAVDSGRICIAALTTANVDYVADAIVQVSLSTR